MAVLAIVPFAEIVLVAITPAAATITIAAVDRASGEVGVAGAGCGRTDPAAAAVLVPGIGAGAIQGGSVDPRSAERLLVALRSGAGAHRAARSAATSQPIASAVQIAVTTVDGPVAAIVEPGSRTQVGQRTQEGAAILGEGLTSGAPLEAAAAAYRSNGGSLADRLLTSLQAADAHGGDRRCADQRASSAFLIVATVNDSPVVPARGIAEARRRVRRVIAQLDDTSAADELADRLLEAAALPRPDGARAPSVYLSILQPPGGFDAVALLRQAFEETTTRSSGRLQSGRTLDPIVRADADRGPALLAALLAALVGVLLTYAARRRSNNWE